MAGRILIADNIPTNRILLKVKLSSAFYDVLQASCGKDAIASAHEHQPEIIILDSDLGDMSAHAACAELKSAPATRHIPVVIVTPFGDSEAKIAALKGGADEFLSKPIDELSLTARVRALMRARATTDELRRRDETAQSLGFSEAPTSFEDQGKITLIGQDIEDAMTWRASLQGLLTDTMEILPADRLLEKISFGESSDTYVISCDIFRDSDGLRLISDIRTRQNTRSAGIVMVHNHDDRDKAIMALDLGANDIITRGADPEELALRIRSQVRRKKETDRLRNTVEEGLRMAMIDPLTGLYNRRYALPHLSKISEQSLRAGHNFAIMLIDLDHFKSVNDTYGHPVGDQVLCEVAKRLKDNLRGVDLVARIGGEEFLVSMPLTNLQDAQVAAERLRSAICKSPVSISTKGQPVTVSASIGLAMGGQPLDKNNPVGIDALLFAADEALYASKSEGRNQVTLGRHAA